MKPSLYINRSLLSFILFLAGVSVSTAQAVSEPLSLEASLTLAIANNPTLKAASGRVVSAGGRAIQSSLWANPELELSAEDWPSKSGSLSESKRLVGVSQVVPFPGKKSLDRQIGATGLRGSEAEREACRRELVRDVKQAYARALVAERTLALAQELIRFADLSAETARRRVNAGAAAEQESLRAEIIAEQYRAEMAVYERELAVARQALASLLGRRDLTGVSLTGTLAEQADLSLLGLPSDRWLDRHPAMLAMLANRTQADLELKRARREAYPDVKVGVAGGREGNTGASLMQFSVSLPLPLIDRGKGRRQEASGKLAVSEAEFAGAEQRLRSDWDQACRRLRSAALQAASYRERILPKAVEALRLVQAGFEQGKFGLIDLLDTQRTNAEVRLTYQQKLLDLNSAQAEVEALAGQEAKVGVSN